MAKFWMRIRYTCMCDTRFIIHIIVLRVCRMIKSFTALTSRDGGKLLRCHKARNTQMLGWVHVNGRTLNRGREDPQKDSTN